MAAIMDPERERCFRRALEELRALLREYDAIRGHRAQEIRIARVFLELATTRGVIYLAQDRRLFRHTLIAKIHEFALVPELATDPATESCLRVYGSLRNNN